MEESKIAFDLSIKKNSFIFNGKTIECDSYISLENKMTLLKDYASTILDLMKKKDVTDNDFSTSYITAEYTIILGIVHCCTNISVQGEERIDIDNLIGSGLWEEIKKNINNYDDFYIDILNIKTLIFEKLKIDSSLNNDLKGIIEKVNLFLSKLSDFNIEDFNGVIKQFESELNKLNEKVPGILSSVEKPKRAYRKANSK